MSTQYRRVKLSLILVFSSLIMSCGSSEESKTEHMERGKRYLAAKDYDRAGIEFKNVLRLDPKSIEAYLLFGQLELDRSNPVRTAGYYSKVIELDPNNYKARLGLAKIYLGASLPDMAKDTIAPALKKNPTDPAAKTIMAVMYTQKGDLEKALAISLEILKADPAQVEAAAIASNIYKTKGDANRAIELLVKAISKDPKVFQLRIALANIYNERKEFDKAAALLAENIKANPSSLDHRVALASYYVQINQLAKAEAVIRDAIKNDPKNSEAHLVLAEFLTTNNRGAQGEKELLAAIDSYPQEFDLRFGLARLYQKIRKFDQAQSVYRNIIDMEKMEPQGIKARKQLAEQFLAQSKVADASRLVEEILKSNPIDSEALLIRSKIELGGDKPNLQAAISDLRVILKGQADSPLVLTMLAQAHQQNNEPDLAREALEKAVALAPNDANANIRYAAFIMQNDHKIDSAERTLDKFLALSPNDALALQAKLEIQMARGNDEHTLGTLTTLKKAHPDLAVGYFRSGDYYFAKGQYQDALREYELARDRSKGEFASIGAIARTLGKLNNTKSALKVLDEYLAKSPKNIEALQLKVSLLAAKDDKAELFKVIDQIKQFYPNNPIADDFAGEYFLSKNNFVEARRNFDAALKKAPTDPRTIGAIATTYLAERKPDAAIAWLAQIESAKPDNALPPYLTGEILYSQKKYAEAQAQYQKTLSRLPKFDQAYMPTRSDVYIHLADSIFLQNDPEKGIATLKAGLVAVPLDTPMLVRLASAYQANGRANDAIAIYEDMLDRDSENLFVKNNLASLLADYKGDGPNLDRARRLAHSFDTSGDPMLMDTLGWIYYKQNEFDHAIPLLKKSADGAPNSVVMHYHLGMAYYKSGDKAAAKKQLSRALSSNEQFFGIEEARSTLKALE